MVWEGLRCLNPQAGILTPVPGEGAMVRVLAGEGAGLGAGWGWEGEGSWLFWPED